MLGKNPGFSTVAVLTLALGIAANSTIFSWINSTLLNPIPGIRDTSNLVSVMRGERSEHPTPPFSYLDYVDLRDNNKTLAGLLGYHDDYVSITGSGRPERIYAALTSANYFDMLGVRSILGRTFLASEENRRDATVVVIGYDLWKNRFGADRNIVGKTVQINQQPFTIIGVAPRRFQGCKTGLRAEMWFPLGMDPVVWGSDRPPRRETFWLNVLGRLKPGVDHRRTESELNSLMQAIFAANKAYYGKDKWAEVQCKSFKIKPKNFEQRLLRVIKNRDITTYKRLVLDVCGLCQKYYPQECADVVALDSRLSNIDDYIESQKR
jgi:hypothetical protein